MTRYCVSQHRIFTINGHSFLFLANENAIFETDPDTNDALNQLSHKGDLCKHDVMGCLRIPDDEKETFFGELLNQKLLLPSLERKEEGERYEKGPIILPLKTLVLHVTDACNLGCLYCYHSFDGANKRTIRKKGAMPVEVARQAIDFLIEHSGGLDDVCLVFFGGEPFLNFNLISQSVQYALEKSEHTGKKMSFTVTTNGTRLSEEVISFLYDHQIGITVSIDGLETIHNKNRPFADGRPSYKAILQNIKNLFKIYNGVPVPARVTVAGSSAHIPETLDHLLSLGFAEVGFAPVTTMDKASQLDSRNMNLLLTQFQHMSDKFVEFALKDQVLGFSNLIDLLAVLHEGEIKNYPCGAGLGLFSVDPDGDLYLCQRLTGEESCFMGDIFNGFSRDNVNDFRDKAVINQKEICTSCWVRNICAGGCYHEALVREDDLMKPNLHYCQWIKKWVETGIKVYGRLATDCPEYLDRISQLRAS